MRLTKLKIAGFKSFVDPTTVTFPSSLTGVVGPNGCGKSNIIDAVRWVMGEISAKHLRGESMADVIFNGSTARKPLGAASVEMVFDNADGKIGGEYATYSEVALRRAVSRDGQSDYYINGTKVRRKDITQLFLGTGLGTRSYAIIEQGMISRVIEARPDDLRSFLEEAAGISKYKERRRETENRIAQTRENLDRLNDLREEVEKQIRHLQRQAATARRYQSLKEEERKLNAELLALRLQSLDAEAQTRSATTEQCETTMQRVLADLREVEAEIERIRAEQTLRSENLNAIQARFFGAGSEVTRLEQSIQHSRALRQRQQVDLEQTQAQAREVIGLIERDRLQLEALSEELATMAPRLDAAHGEESAASASLEGCEQALSAWQATWDKHATAVAHAQRETQVERARIEQFEAQERRLLQQRERQEAEHAALAQQQPAHPLELLSEQADAALEASQNAADRLQEFLAALSGTRERERSQAQALNALRARWQQELGKQVSTEALQQAALGKASGKVTQWLKSQHMDELPRVAQQLRVERGWERAVETVLGSYLEAVCVDGLDSVTDLLGSFDGGQLAVVSAGESVVSGHAASLQAKVQSTAVLSSVLAQVYAADSLSDAMSRRQSLALGESVVTRDGIWIGQDWLRLSRDRDPRSGVIEREESLREIRAEVTRLADEVRELERELEQSRAQVREQEDQREHFQTEVNRMHREQVDKKALFAAAQVRTADVARRLEQLATGLADIGGELDRAGLELRTARGRIESAIDVLAALEPQRVGLEAERDRMRGELARARAATQDVQQRARNLAVEVGSRRSSHASLTASLARVQQQQEGLQSRLDELGTQIEVGAEPLVLLQTELEEALRVRVQIEGELQAARVASNELDSLLRARDALRATVESQVEQARNALDSARMAAEQVRIRRENVAEQLTATNFDLAELKAQMAPEANLEGWEAQLTDTRGKIERLGQVNLAAIGEFKEQSERKEYLDRQCKDLTDALETLETAMRKIDRETRTRFQDTFDRVNAGFKEKFPLLFGGGHAYLEMMSEENGDTSGGISVMARPPGKRNSTISQLSGGEKALTAVALVFSIFDLNPAPFCLLDEVDAPLDENNVGRFCDIVREMSKSVQFIFITHNKTTMELASQLVGVTMHEPGVSRLVAVDVDEAVRMAAM